MLLLIFVINVCSTIPDHKFVVIAPKMPVEDCVSNNDLLSFHLHRSLLQIYEELICCKIKGLTCTSRITTIQFFIALHNNYFEIIKDYTENVKKMFVDKEGLNNANEAIDNFLTAFFDNFRRSFLRLKSLSAPELNNFVMECDIKYYSSKYINNLKSYLCEFMFFKQKNVKDEKIVWGRFIEQLGKDTTYLVWYNSICLGDDKLTKIIYKADITYIDTTDFYNDIVRILLLESKDKLAGTTQTHNIYIRIDIFKLLVDVFILNTIYTRTIDILNRNVDFILTLFEYIDIKKNVDELKILSYIQNTEVYMQSLIDFFNLCCDDRSLLQEKRLYWLDLANIIHDMCNNYTNYLTSVITEKEKVTLMDDMEVDMVATDDISTNNTN